MVSTRQQILARQGKPTSPENCSACQYARSKPGQHVFPFLVKINQYESIQ
jgi:hypothetical protein